MLENNWGERLTAERKKEILEEFEENRRRQFLADRMKKVGIYFLLACNLFCILISLFK